MPITLEGGRRRYFSERAHVREVEGNPIRREVSEKARLRLTREIYSMLQVRGSGPGTAQGNYAASLAVEWHRFDGSRALSAVHLESAAGFALPRFLDFLELSAKWVHMFEGDRGINVLQSILADDCSAYRFKAVQDARQAPEFHIMLVDNEHLHREVVDRTFELTSLPAFAPAQRDYAEAWQAYRRSDFDDAIFKGGRAVESACKVAIVSADPARDLSRANLAQVVPMLVELGLLPSRSQSVISSLSGVFTHSGALRNQAGVGHGSTDLSGPEAHVTLFALRLGGTLISFLAEQHSAAPTP